MTMPEQIESDITALRSIAEGKNSAIKIVVDPDHQFSINRTVGSLKHLASEGLIESSKKDGTNYYEVTESGINYLEIQDHSSNT